ncbi:MAG: ribosomal protein [Deltaproteobacteria bacterium]|jgi:large subunit ribosomal protein L13|nr:ribosomal protein [Deltaproteobacteria bacterium]
MKTYDAKKGEIEQSWYVVDAESKVLGRLATRVADVLRGKHKPIFTPYVDTGDFVVVINAEKIHLTGTKMDNKKYYRHSGYPGGLKITTPAELLRKKPEAIIMHAVKGMLPKTKLGRQQFKKLKVYAGKDHPHQAQQPSELKV